MFSKPLVSIIVPIYNVERYLDACIDSLCGQTYKEIEILLMNDGSTDSSPEICEKWCKKDERMILHGKRNTGYGDTVNQGIDLAQGKYVIVIESDDFVEPKMVEDLVLLAEQNEVDFVKADYYRNWYGEKVKSNNFDRNKCICNEVFSAKENMNKFNTDASVWSAIYRKDFLDRNEIRFRTTPGASFQDIGFIFKVFASAERGYFTSGAYVNYRQENEEASARSREKVMAVVGELRSCEEFLDSQKMDACFYPWLMRSRFNTYRWNLSRIAPQFVDDFMEVFLCEIKQDIEAGRYFKEEYSPGAQAYMQRLLDQPEQLAREIKEEKLEKEYIRLYETLIFEKIKKDSLTYIYGAGKLGQEVYRYLTAKMPGCNLRFVCTEGDQEKGIYGIEQIPAGDELIIIAIRSVEERAKVFGELQKKGFTRIWVWSSFFDRMIKSNK